MATVFYLTQSSAGLQSLVAQRPQGLLPVAGDALLSHVLDMYRPLLDTAASIITADHPDEVRSWLGEHFPELAAHTVAAPAPRGSLAGLAALAAALPPDEPLLVLPGDAVLKVAWDERPAGAEALLWTADRAASPLGAVTLRDDGRVAGVRAQGASAAGAALTGGLWVARAGLLFDHLPPDGAPAGLALAWIQAGIGLYAAPAAEWEPTDTPEQLLHANKRLLSVGYGTREALERSFAEGFAVIPPVYLHETSEVNSAVIGPYASIGPHCVVRDAVIRNTVLGTGTTVERAFLDGALIGENGHVTGRSYAPFLGDHTAVDLG